MSLTSSSRFMSVSGRKTEILEWGEGAPLLFLHSEGGLLVDAPALEPLSRRTRVIAPSHPGFGRSELGSNLMTVSDLAFHYLDFIRDLDLRDFTMVGVGFGGWIAAEIAVMSPSVAARLVLADCFGIKIGDRETRDIVDMFGVTRDELLRLSYVEPEMFAIDPRQASDEDLRTAARNFESTARFGWSPYMHNPALAGRLARIEMPTIVLWGALDGVVTPDYGRAYAGKIPGAEFRLVDGAAHYPHVEKPEVFAEAVVAFSN